MRIFFIVFSIFIFIGLLGWFGFKKLGDIRPAFLPTNSQIANKFEESKNQPLGEKVSIPLQVADGLNVGLFARDLGKARGMAISPEGVLLVSDMSGKGSIYALPDKNGDGIADEKKVVLTGLNNTHGLTFYNNQLFVTEKTKVSRYKWDGQNLTAEFDKKLFDLPNPGGHFTRTIVFDKAGKMYVSLGSSCNVCQEKEPFFASVIVSDAEGVSPRVFAKGLRNSVALAIEPVTQELWGAENGRDLLGDSIPPEEINIIKDGQNYGWPNCYGNQIHDTNYDKNSYIVDPCLSTQPMIYGLPAHNAPLGMAFVPENFKPEWKDDIVVGLHGSWNRSTPDGYKVVRLDREGNTIKGMEDLLSGFIRGSNAEGRPVDVIFDEKGNLYISDDKAGNIYILNKK
jgi:glucose/arabinose dehydrogenase